MKKIMICSLFLTVHLIFVLSIVDAKTITVKKDGTGDYTVIQSAVNAAKSGDAIEIHEGIYKENINIEKSGSITSQFTIRVAANANVIIDGTTGEYTIDLSPGDYWKIDGTNGHLTIKNGNFGIRSYQASNLEIMHLTITSRLEGWKRSDTTRIWF